MYLISGLQSGHTALYTKIHHAIIDGVSGAEILGLLLDFTPEGCCDEHSNSPSNRGGRFQ